MVIDRGVTLERSTSILTVEFVGEVSLPGEPDENVIVAIAIVEHGGELTTRELSGHLLGTEATYLASRLLEGASQRGLVTKTGEDSWTTTAEGIKAVRENAIRTERSGSWQAAFIEDPLVGTLPYRISTPQRQPNLYAEVRGIQAQSPNLTPVPALLRDWVGKEFQLPASPGLGPIITGIHSRNSIMTRSEVGPLLEWQPLKGTVVLREADQLTSVSGFDASVDSIGYGLAQGVGGVWETKSETVRLRASQASERQVQTLSLDLDGTDVEVIGLGEFIATKGSVGILPFDTQDARLWFLRRCHISLDTFVIQDRWRPTLSALADGLDAEVVDGFTQHTAASDLRNTDPEGAQTRAFWYLQAPLDWDI